MGLGIGRTAIGALGDQRVAMVHKQAISNQANASREASRTRDEVYQVDERVDRLKLTCFALWTLLEDTLGVTQDQLIERIAEIDAADGRRDGIYRRPAERCECGAAVGVGTPHCQFCGATAPPAAPFDLV